MDTRHEDCVSCIPDKYCVLLTPNINIVYYSFQTNILCVIHKRHKYCVTLKMNNEIFHSNRHDRY